MLPLSLCLAQSGREVSAEDDKMGDAARKALGEAGVRVGRPIAEEREGLLVVRSTAVGPDHPSMALAKERGWKTMRRGECLAQLAKGKRLIAVVGSHGKTTTTGMLIDLLRAGEARFSHLMGGSFRDGSPCGRWDEGSDWLVAEIDESDRTIDLFDPEILLWLNADYDHHSHYPSQEEYLSAFRRAAGRTRGSVVLGPGMSLEGANLRPGVGVWAFGQGEGRARLRAALEAGGSRLTIEAGDRRLETWVNRSEPFNQANAAMALLGFALATDFATPPARIDFRDIERRQCLRFLSPRVRVLDDYAHHPVEISQLLGSLKAASKRPLVAVFQPHRYSRTASLKRELAESLKGADEVWLAEVYAASEQPMAGGRIEDLQTCLREAGKEARLVRFADDLIDALARRVEAGAEADLLFLGAGETDRWARELADRLVPLFGRWGPLFREFSASARPDSKLVADEDLSRKTTLRVGGAADLYCEPLDESELAALLRICHRESLPLYPLGRGSNLIVPDEGVRGLVIRLGQPYWRRWSEEPGDRLRVGAGLRIKELCGIAARLELSGFEFLEGIPGNVGGALRMNAGAMGGWIFDLVESVTYLTMRGERVTRRGEEMETGYRYCRELGEGIAIEAVLRAGGARRPQAEIRRSIDVYQGKRKETQPREPSAGCIFRNPEGDSAGRIIDVLGLKGTAIGGAEISPTHGNFIVNTGGASSQDVIELIKLVRRVAWKKKRIELEPEALLYGGSWKEALS